LQACRCILQNKITSQSQLDCTFLAHDSYADVRRLYRGNIIIIIIIISVSITIIITTITNTTIISVTISIVGRRHLYHGHVVAPIADGCGARAASGFE
jgi:hypothetical protein